jgi:hypothetical protein
VGFFFRSLAIITGPLRQTSAAGEAADANDAFSLAKWLTECRPLRPFRRFFA